MNDSKSSRSEKKQAPGGNPADAKPNSSDKSGDSAAYKKILALMDEIKGIKGIQEVLARENRESKELLNKVKKIIDLYRDRIEKLKEENEKLNEYKNKCSALAKELEEKNEMVGKMKAMAQSSPSEKPDSESKKRIAFLEEEIKKKNEITKKSQGPAAMDPEQERLMIVWLRSSLQGEQKINAELKEKIKNLEVEIKSLKSKKT